MNIFEKIFDYFEKDKYHACFRLCMKATKIYPEDAYSWFYKGKVEFEFQEFESSITSFEKAINLGCQNNNIWTAMGLSYEKIGKQRLALDCYLKEVKNFPENCYGWQILAGFLSRVDRFKLGKKIFDSVVKKNAFDDRISAVEYADCLYYAGTSEDELVFYKRIRKMNYPLKWIEIEYRRVLNDLKHTPPSCAET